MPVRFTAGIKRRDQLVRQRTRTAPQRDCVRHAPPGATRRHPPALVRARALLRSLALYCNLVGARAIARSPSPWSRTKSDAFRRCRARAACANAPRPGPTLRPSRHSACISIVSISFASVPYAPLRPGSRAAPRLRMAAPSAATSVLARAATPQHGVALNARARVGARHWPRARGAWRERARPRGASRAFRRKEMSRCSMHSKCL